MRYVNGHNRKASLARPYATRARFSPVMAGLATPCWLAPQKPEPNGYVRVSEGGESRYAHVLLWEASHGPVPVGLELDHKCRNRWCINPSHLEPVTRAVNVQRGATAKLSPADVLAIRASSEHLKVLAERFDVSITSVWAARRGLTWRNVA